MKNNYLLISILFLAFVSCKKKEEDEDISPVKKTYKVTYEIGCTDCQVIYYKDSLQTQAVEDHKNSSWTFTFYGRKNQEVLLFAYNTSSVAQGVTATIKVNDTVTTTQTNYCPVSGNAFVVDSLE